MKPVLGIDLGTTKCVACVRLGDEFVEIPPEVGKDDKILPSLFIHLRDGTVHVGKVVEREYEQNATYAGEVVRNAKRFMRLDATYRFESGKKKFSPAEVLAEFLRVLRAAAARYTDRLKQHPAAKDLDWTNWLDSVVITVPAYFSSTERRATKRAAGIAGFPSADVHLLDEPVAAALANGVHLGTKAERVLVVDLGGGTCDLTLLETGGSKGFRELGRFGDNEFGGLDWDCDLAKRAIKQSPLKNTHPDLLGEDGYPDYMRYGTMIRQAERAKINYCEDDHEVKFTLHLVDPDDRTFSRAVSLPRSEIDALSNPLCEYVGHLGDRLLESISTDVKKARSGVKWTEVGQLLLVGGGSQIPGVRAVLTQRWGREVEPPAAAQLAVARGAATYGQIVGQGKRLDGISHPRCPHDIGVMTLPAPTRTWAHWFASVAGRPSTNGVTSTERIFQPLLRRNSELPSRFDGWFPLSSRSHRVEIKVCFVQYTRQRPLGAVQILRKLTLNQLPPLVDARQDGVALEFVYDNDHRLHVKGHVRGKPIEFDLDDFSGEGRL